MLPESVVLPAQPPLDEDVFAIDAVAAQRDDELPVLRLRIRAAKDAPAEVEDHHALTLDAGAARELHRRLRPTRGRRRRPAVLNPELAARLERARPGTWRSSCGSACRGSDQGDDYAGEQCQATVCASHLRCPGSPSSGRSSNVGRIPEPIGRSRPNCLRRRGSARPVSAVVLALVAAVLFGAMAATLGVAFQRSLGRRGGSPVTGVVALGVTAAPSLNALSDSGDLWPFLLTGLIAPGGSQLLYVMAVKEVGASRAAVIAGAGPLVAVTIAFAILDEPIEPALVAGAVLIVLGVFALAGERDRPEHLRFIGLVLALASTVFFATRDNIVRWLAEDTAVDPQLAAAATIVSGSAVMATYVLFPRRGRIPGTCAEPSARSLCPACSGSVVRRHLRGLLPWTGERRQPAHRHGGAFRRVARGRDHRAERADRTACHRCSRAHRLRRRPDRCSGDRLHLDLDASSQPSRSWKTRRCARSRSSSEATRRARRRCDRELPRRRFGIHSAMSCAEALDAVHRRCSSRPGTRSTATTRRASGTPCATSSRRSSAPASTRAISTSTRSRRTSSARRVAEAVQAAVRGATSLSASLGVAPCKVVAKVASDWRKPAGLTVVPAGRELRSSRRSTCGGCQRRGRDRGAVAQGGPRDDRTAR